MPTLLLMRHAKSDWSDASCPDHDRPLNARGKRDAPRMGRWLAEQSLGPTRIVASSAKRARKTADRVVSGLAGEVPIEVREDLYHATADHWLSVLAELPGDANCVLCIGHNPGLEALLERLTGNHERLPTAAIACLDLHGEEWSAIVSAPEGVSLRAVWRPKEIHSEHPSRQ
ncbi:MAG: histidine phosphatase family protein [Planctomycetaceae bacterium]|nr:histidine phosphatase family protein [Planctomycetaceae bacterium]